MKYIGNLRTYSSSQIEKSRISIGFEGLDRELFRPEKCYELLGKSGIKYARCQSGWAKCELEKGVYTFEWLDNIINSLISQGLKPWLCISYGNPIYMIDIDKSANSTCVGCAPILYGEEVYEAWKNYVLKLAEHFSGRIEYFEIWNEPDLNHFWYPEEPDCAKYAKMLNDTGRIVKECIPNAKIGGVCSSYKKLDFAEELAKKVDKDILDFYCYHAYSMNPEKGYIQNVKELRNTFNENGLENVELWQGEAGCPSYFPPNHWLKPKKQATERLQAVWQLRRYFLDFYAGTSMSSFYQIADMMERPYQKAREELTNPARHGILNGIKYTPKESYYTLSRLATVFSGNVELCENRMKLTVNTQNNEVEPIIISFKRNGFNIFSYYIPYYVEEEIATKFDGKIEFDATEIKEPCFIDMYTGEVFEAKVKNGVIYDAPVAQYPILLCEKSAFEILEQK